MQDWQESLKLEFIRAEAARAAGNEGRARVCARRAAGIAVREFLARQGTDVRTPSAYDLLNLLKEDAAIAPEIKGWIEHLTVRVTEEFRLPVEADLIAEARQLCQALLPDWEPGAARAAQ
jgi:hypothetical protein